jgi:hypothetical protein
MDASLNNDMTYTFLDKYKRIIEVELRITEYDAFVTEHPELTRWLESAPAVTYNGKHFGSLDAQMPSGFKDVLQKIGEANPYTELGDNYRANKKVKEIQTRDICRNYAKKLKKNANQNKKGA